jgi:transitional endoplasmic reticulum ATPase
MNAILALEKGGRGPKGFDDLQDSIELTSSQQEALNDLTALFGNSGLIALAGDPGMGLSTVLRVAAEQLNGSLVTLGDIFRAMRTAPTHNWDLALLRYLQRRLERCDVLLIDGLQYFTTILSQSSHGRFARQALAETLIRQAERYGKTIIIGGAVPAGQITAQALYYRADVPIIELPRFGSGDYQHIVRSVVGAEMAAAIDFSHVLRFAPLMNGHELKVAAGVAARRGAVDTYDFLNIVSDFVITANTRTQEVEEISFEMMPGMEQVADALETHVVLPLTDIELAERFDLRPKRGILLYGPPGTGKTSVGRALAHRLKGRFFLIDGSVKTEPAIAFLETVQAIVNDAIANAPSVIFIDDADVLFDIGHAAGLGRYLLTLLDGLSSESASKVCVMMTAMDASKVPEAILRSGRVELWLETRAPDLETRAAILRRWMGDILPNSDTIDYPLLAKRTSGFNAADLRRVAGDARAYYATDIDRNRSQASGTDYVLRAINSVIATREAMAANLADPSLRIE